MTDIQLKKKICFDLDGTICTNTFGDYSNAKPFAKSIKAINYLYESGSIHIIIYTARFMGKYDGNVELVYNHGYEFTNNQLVKWGVKFHKLIMGKPEYDLFIDDKAYKYSFSWQDEIVKAL